jgi:hypothetical protein
MVALEYTRDGCYLLSALYLSGPAKEADQIVVQVHDSHSFMLLSSAAIPLLVGSEKPLRF